MRLRDVKKGDRFFESDHGYDVLCAALGDAYEVDNPEQGQRGHGCVVYIEAGAGAVQTGDTITMFECHDPGCYGLRLTPYDAE